MCACTVSTLLASCAASGGNEVSAYVTTADRVYDLAKDTLNFTPSAGEAGTAVIRLDAATTQEELLAQILAELKAQNSAQSTK